MTQDLLQRQLQHWPGAHNTEDTNFDAGSQTLNEVWDEGHNTALNACRDALPESNRVLVEDIKEWVKESLAYSTSWKMVHTDQLIEFLDTLISDNQDDV